MNFKSAFDRRFEWVHEFVATDEASGQQARYAELRVANQAFEVFLHGDDDLIVIGDLHQRQVVDGLRPVGLEGTPQRGEGVLFAREAPEHVAGLRVDHVDRAVRGARGDALGYRGTTGREFLLDEGVGS